MSVEGFGADVQCLPKLTASSRIIGCLLNSLKQNELLVFAQYAQEACYPQLINIDLARCVKMSLLAAEMKNDPSHWHSRLLGLP